ncbi:MAG: hypothetical protein ACYC9O_01425 [Candidatus Latescibacterota bacterium]
MRFNRIVFTGFVFLAITSISFADVVVHAYLYNPKTDSAVVTYPYQRENQTLRFHPYLVITGTGAPEGKYQLDYTIESSGKPSFQGSIDLETQMGLLVKEIKLDRRYPSADRVRWTLKGQNTVSFSGSTPLTWSRFHGKVTFLDPRKKSDAYIEMQTFSFGAPGKIYIPIEKDGSFDELVPARVYRVLNINSTGYSYNAMERWAWDYDLTRDREDEFTIGRTEIYSMRVFEVVGGPRTLFVAFRPTALSRVLKLDADGNGLVEGEERKAMGDALKKSCTAIGPELKAENIKVWINGKPQTVLNLTQIPEYNGDDMHQVQYIFQVYPAERLFGVSHEIKVEVESEEELNGKKIRDWGQGSVGYYPLGYGLGLF